MLTAAFFMVQCSLFIIASCSSIDCPVQNSVTTQYAVYNADGSTTLNDTLWVITKRIDGKDTLLNSLVDATAFQLPISYSNPEDTLLFIIHDKDNIWTLDTLLLKKEDIPHFESVDCSPHFFHRLTATRCTHYGIDSVTIENPMVDYDQNKTHLRIYFGGMLR